MTRLFDRVCPVNGKKQFPTRLLAELELEFVKGERAAGRMDDERVEQRAYECPHCDTWHLTSRPLA